MRKLNFSVVILMVLLSLAACSDNQSTQPDNIIKENPSNTLTSPTTSNTFSTSQNTITLQGNVTTTGVTISCTNNGLACTNDTIVVAESAGTTNWTIPAIALTQNDNAIEIIATDINSDTYVAEIVVTYSLVNQPLISITSPTSNASYSANNAQLSLAGTASDDVTTLSWTNNRGGSGSIPPSANWQINAIALLSGDNVITVTVGNGLQQNSDVITVSYQPIVITSPTSANSYSTTTANITLGGTATSDVTSINWANDQGGAGSISASTTWQIANIALVVGANMITVTASTASQQYSDSLTVTYSTGTTTVVHSTFTQELVDDPKVANDAVAPWGKNLADIDGDGDLDVAIGGGNVGSNIFWYQYPGWARYQIGSSGGGDDLQFTDINSDGAIDVVVNGGEIAWYENPMGTSGGDPKTAWTKHAIDGNTGSHDLQVGDVNNDGKPDVATRGEFGPTYLYLQTGVDTWLKISFPNAPDGEGTALADLNQDGKVDIVANGYWLEQPANLVTDSWPKHVFTNWGQAAADVQVIDINKDGRLDIFLSDSETGPGNISWFEGPVDVYTNNWTEHSFNLVVEDIHRFHVVDVNNDGKEDVVFAEMHQSPQKRLAIYYNTGLGVFESTPQILSTNGGHNMAVGDIDQDGDIDLLLANWDSNPQDSGEVYVWMNNWNQTNPTLSLDQWTEIEIDANKTGQVFGLNFADINGDSRIDIFTGQYWYANPGGNVTATWTRTDIATNIAQKNIDAMLALDVDGDGRVDLIAEEPLSNGTTVGVYWLKPSNTSATTWTSMQIGTIPADQADSTSQGFRLGQINPGGLPEIILSSVGINYFQIPSDPTVVPWPKINITANAKEEGIAVGDIDTDGDLDIAGIDSDGKTIKWWENPNNGLGNWTAHAIGSTIIAADRIELADMNRDGKLDIIATETDNSASPNNHLYWFAQPASPTATNWPITTVTSSDPRPSLNAMDVEDINKDGLPDIVTGEHGCVCNTLKTTVWENSANGSQWTKHIVNTNTNKVVETHLGTQLVDLDQDGDLDMVSIGWYDSAIVRIWRNDAIANF